MDRQRNAGILLVVLGAFFLIARYADAGTFLWPLFVIGPGIGLLAWAILGGVNTANLAVPGSIVTMVGLILFVQALTGRFETWAYAWGLVVAAVGIGTWLYGTLADREKEVHDGWRTATGGLMMFAAFGVFFEFIIGIGGRSSMVGSWLVPLLLIGAGVYLLWRRRAV